MLPTSSTHLVIILCLLQEMCLVHFLAFVREFFIMCVWRIRDRCRESAVQIMQRALRREDRKRGWLADYVNMCVFMYTVFYVCYQFSFAFYRFSIGPFRQLPRGDAQQTAYRCRQLCQHFITHWMSLGFYMFIS